MSGLVPLLLTIHVLTAIAAFGPSLAIPLIAGMAAKEPAHGLFALRLTDRLMRRLIIPLALTMPISGGLLVWSEGLDVAPNHWLLVAIGLYLVLIAFAIGYQLRLVGRMIRLAQDMAGSPPAAPAVAPSAKFLEMKALGARAQAGGIILTLLVVLIVSLMAGKPAI